MLVSKDSILWYDKSTKELVAKDLKNSTIKTTENSNELLGLEIPYYKNKLKLALTSFIKSSKINDEDCYLIVNNESKTYINKDTGVVLKIDEGKNGVTEYTNWKFDQLTDEDMKKPSENE